MYQLMASASNDCTLLSSYQNTNRFWESSGNETQNHNTLTRSSKCTMVSPDPSWYKINFDGAVFEREDNAGLASKGANKIGNV